MNEQIQAEKDYSEIIKQYKNYEKNTYQSMTLNEKIDFFLGVHSEDIPLFDEEGMTLWTLWDYGEITKEFIQHPEVFAVEDILKFIVTLNDEHYESDMMDDILKIVRSIIRFYGKDAAIYLLNHLTDIPECGKEWGWCRCLQFLIVDDNAFPCLKEAVMTVDSSVQKLVLQIINGEIDGLFSLKKWADEEPLHGKIKEIEKVILNDKDRERIGVKKYDK